MNFQDKVSFIWSIAELLRGDYKQSEYGRIVLPFTVLRRLDSVLAETKQAVLDQIEQLKTMGFEDEAMDPILKTVTKQTFYNKSQYDFISLLNDADNLSANLMNYIQGFSKEAYDILEHFDFTAQIKRLDKANLLYQVTKRFSEIDLHPDRVSNIEMGYIFEELIRRFSEQSNETAGEHFTPREVIRLMVNLIFNDDSNSVLNQKGIVRTMYDPACGTGGMLTVAQEYLRDLNPDAELKLFGQELNAESYAICKGDMLIKGQDVSRIKLGNSFSEDGLPSEKFDYMLANPPFGVEWKKVQDFIQKEHEERGFSGRFGAGLPRVSDGSLLFLQHMISKMQPVSEGGSRLAIVFNGSPLFTGSAGSGESEIRRWIIENDWLEAIVALPDQLFYNTGILTYVWVVTNRKEEHRKGKVQLINATSFYQKMRKGLGSKRHELSDEHIQQITKIYGEFQEGLYSKIFDNEDFGYYRVTIERPLRLRFDITNERIEALKEQKAFQNLATSRKKGEAGEKEIEEGKKLQQGILDVLEGMLGKTYLQREEFTTDLKNAFKAADIKLSSTIQKAIISAIGERDEEAEICRDSKGNVEADSELRDYENIPLKEDIQEYMKREVLPHVPDAWVNEEATKVGYEIPFTRHFYEYVPLRDIEDIGSEIKELESEIRELLSGI